MLSVRTGRASRRLGPSEIASKFFRATCKIYRPRQSDGHLELDLSTSIGRFPYMKPLFPSRRSFGRLRADGSTLPLVTSTHGRQENHHQVDVTIYPERRSTLLKPG